MEPDHRSVTDVLDARVSASTYLAMLGICVFPIRAIGVAGGIRNSNWLLAYVAVGMALCIIIGLSVFRLKILNGVLYYREFARYQTINIGDIDRAMIETPHRGKGLYQQLSIYGRIDSTK